MLPSVLSRRSALGESHLSYNSEEGAAPHRRWRVGLWAHSLYIGSYLFSPMKPERMGGKSSELKTAVEAKVGIIAPAKL